MTVAIIPNKEQKTLPAANRLRAIDQSFCYSYGGERDCKKSKKNSCSDELVIGIAEGGARTHDLEVDLFAVIRATRSTN